MYLVYREIPKKGKKNSFMSNEAEDITWRDKTWKKKLRRNLNRKI